MLTNSNEPITRYFLLYNLIDEYQYVRQLVFYYYN